MTAAFGQIRQFKYVYISQRREKMNKLAFFAVRFRETSWNSQYGTAHPSRGQRPAAPTDIASACGTSSPPLPPPPSGASSESSSIRDPFPAASARPVPKKICASTRSLFHVTSHAQRQNPPSPQTTIHEEHLFHVVPSFWCGHPFGGAIHPAQFVFCFRTSCAFDRR